MEIQQIIQLLFQRADAMLTFWNFYIAVSTAILGFLAAAKTEWLNRFVCFVLTVGFMLFTIGNLWALLQVREQREALITLVSLLEGYNQRIASVVESTHPPDLTSLIVFHGVLDITVITLIWVIVLLRRKRLVTANRVTGDF